MKGRIKRIGPSPEKLNRRAAKSSDQVNDVQARVSAYSIDHAFAPDPDSRPYSRPLDLLSFIERLNRLRGEAATFKDEVHAVIIEGQELEAEDAIAARQLYDFLHKALDTAMDLIPLAIGTRLAAEDMGEIPPASIFPVRAQKRLPAATRVAGRADRRKPAAT